MLAPFSPHNLTIDERKAAEAAFKGDPFNPTWSPAARSVYEGISNALGTRIPFAEQPATDPTDLNETPIARPVESEREGPTESSPVPLAAPAPMMTYEEAIQAGLLIDVTPIAQSVGLPLPVSISKPLWDFGITASYSLPEDQHEARVRDVLLALRLRLATQPIASPSIEFPALLSFPAKPTPQLLSLHAIAHGNRSEPFSLVVLLSSEISAAIRPLNN